jgi:hypothetical protein
VSRTVNSPFSALLTKGGLFMASCVLAPTILHIDKSIERMVGAVLWYFRFAIAKGGIFCASIRVLAFKRHVKQEGLFNEGTRRTLVSV